MAIPDSDLISEIKLEGKDKYKKDVDDAASSAEMANERIGKSGQKASDSVKKQAKETSRAVDATTNFGRILSDLPFGMVAVSNNIVPMVESFSRLKAEVGGTTAALRLMGSFMMGPGGIIIAASLVSGAMAGIPMLMRAIGNGAKEAKNEVESLSQTIDRLIPSMAKFDSALSPTNLNLNELKQVVSSLQSVIQNIRFVGITGFDPIVANQIITNFKKQIEEESIRQKIGESIKLGLSSGTINLFGDVKRARMSYAEVLDQIATAEKGLADAVLDGEKKKATIIEKNLQILNAYKSAYESLGATELIYIQNLSKFVPAHSDYAKAVEAIYSGQTKWNVSLKQTAEGLKATVTELKPYADMIHNISASPYSVLYDENRRNRIPQISEVPIQQAPVDDLIPPLSAVDEFWLYWNEATRDGMTTIRAFSRDAASTIVEAMYGAKVKLKDIFDAIAKDMLRAFIQMGILKLIDLIVSAATGTQPGLTSKTVGASTGGSFSGMSIMDAEVTSGFPKLASQPTTIVIETPSPEATKAYWRKVNRNVLIPDYAEYSLSNTGGSNPFTR